jgi:hypothetical protein
MTYFLGEVNDCMDTGEIIENSVAAIVKVLC